MRLPALIRHLSSGLLLAILLCSFSSAQNPRLLQPIIGHSTIDVQPFLLYGYTEKLTVYDSCAAGANKLMESTPVPADTTLNANLNKAKNSGFGDIQHLPLPARPATSTTSAWTTLTKDNYICVAEEFDPPATSTAVTKTEYSLRLQAKDSPTAANQPCTGDYNDCSWGYTAVGGVEQSALSAQDSQTDGFVDLFVRGPMDNPIGSVWLQARLLGAPDNSNTQNIASVSTDASAGITSSTLSSVGYAVDYMVGYEHDFRQGKSFTYGPIAGFGATTPLSSQHATVAYAVPDYGTNECTELLHKFAKGNPTLPGSSSIVTTTTTGGGGPVTTTSPTYCSVNQTPTSTISTTGGVTTTTASSGTQITNIAFSPQDRSSFLLKYSVGLRLINRFSKNSSCNPVTASPLTDECNRSIVDFSIGQDESITGGMLRHLVFKSSAIFPIPNSGIYIFLSASNRLEKNIDSAPLILTPTPIFTGTGTPPVGSVVVPSSSVFVLPYTQSDRDFYRIGIAIDLARILPKLFAPPS